MDNPQLKKGSALLPPSNKGYPHFLPSILWKPNHFYRIDVKKSQNQYKSALKPDRK